MAVAGAAAITWWWGPAREDARLKGLDRIQLADYVSRRPNSAVGHRHYAGALFNAGRLDDAVVEFRKAISLDPNSAEARVGLGAALHAAGEEAEAEHALRTALEIDPTHANAHFFLALTIAPRRPREAMEALERCAELDPSYTEAWYQLSLLRAKLNYNEEAAEAAQRAVALDPTDADHHEALGQAQARAGQIAEALASLRKALDLDPLRPRALLTYASAMLQATSPDLDAAEEAVGRAVQLAGASAQASTTLARIAERRGDVSSARQHYEQALELDPTWKSALFGLGSLLATGGDRSRSRALLAEFERLEAAEDELSVAATAAQAKPDDPEAQLALARALRKAGQPRLAADRYARYLGMRADPAAEAEYVDVICELATPEPSGPQASERP